MLKQGDRYIIRAKLFMSPASPRLPLRFQGYPGCCQGLYPFTQIYVYEAGVYSRGRLMSQ